MGESHVARGSLEPIGKKARSTADQTRLFGTISESIMIDQGLIFIASSIP